MKKISELGTDKAFDFLCEIIPHISDIIGDEELMKELKSAIDFDGAKTKAEKIVLITDKLSSIILIILKKKRHSIYKVLSLLEEKSIEDIENQNIMITLENIRILSKDDDLVNFFKSYIGMEKRA